MVRLQRKIFWQTLLPKYSMLNYLPKTNRPLRKNYPSYTVQQKILMVVQSALETETASNSTIQDKGKTSLNQITPKSSNTLRCFLRTISKISWIRMAFIHSSAYLRKAIPKLLNSFLLQSIIERIVEERSIKCSTWVYQANRAINLFSN